MSLRYDAGEVITAMVTPFNKDLEVDYAQVEKLAAYLVDNGSDGILVAGTTGESPTLTHEEEWEVLSVVKKTVGNKAKIMIGAGSNSTKTAVETTKKVSKLGVDCILSVVPYYNKPSQAGMFEHFSQIAQSTDLPVFIYNIPGRCVVNMCPETMAKLAQKHQNIVGVKQSNANLDEVTEIASITPDGFTIYSGDDSLTLPMMSLGGHGVVSVASHVIGNDIKQMIRAFKNGDLKIAQQLQYKSYPVFKNLFTSPNPGPVKTVLANRGIINDYVRPPLVVLTDEQKKLLFKFVK
ncbi:MAG: 4-hydroxy-tetrahydrodipicolinate synthase [Candidatus Gastranaerophilales bacterium]|nr:4-hydroxy-tetrahydrodipicolinate synthase [Candidatus Gastranaerophilales bacterium]